MKVRSTKKGKDIRRNTYRKRYYQDHVPSAGENRIQRYLNENKILHMSEARFNDCKNPKTGELLPFDFFLLKEKIIIEYDGSQHYEYTPKYHGKKNSGRFEAQQARDEIKNNYCKKKKYKLIRIKYTDWDNIEEILKNEIK